MSKRTRQYMSAIFYHNENQQRLAIETKNEFERKKQKGKVMTQISPAETFYDAEDISSKVCFETTPMVISELRLGSRRSDEISCL
uniref:peptide-methionine (S)-S-oxide reductase n=1 Tax=Strigamia maritima TaxID=126957 RepID=T1IYX0_STRMM